MKTKYRYQFYRFEGWWYAVECGVFIAGPFRRKHELITWYKEVHNEGA
jgi:hypothetical protein